MLTVRNLRAGYGGRDVVNSVDLDVAAGEIVVLIGHNGAGKSTVLKALFNLVPQRAGEIAIDGRDLGHLPAHRLLSAGLAYVPQEHSTFPQLTIAENLRMGGYLLDDQGLYRSRLRSIEEMFPRLAERADQVAGSLSGGEQRMLEIARTLLMEPKVILLDEPSIGLAPSMVRSLFATLQVLKSRGTAVLVVEQSVRAALENADRGYVLELGRIALQDRAASLLGDTRVAKLYMGAKRAS